ALYLIQNSTTTLDNGVSTFARNTATGELSFVETIAGGPLSVLPHVAGLTDAAMSPDSEHLYTQAIQPRSSAAARGRLSRAGALQAFDATTQANRATVTDSTNLAVVAAGRAAWMALGGLFTSALKLYDAGKDTTQTVNPVIAGTGPEKNKLALSSQAVVYTLPPLLGQPAKLVVASTTPPFADQRIDATPIDLGATDVCAGGAHDGDACTPDADCPGGACRAVAVFTHPYEGRPGTVLELYRAADASTEVVRFGGSLIHNVVDFQVNGSIIAFRVGEIIDLTNWNNDSDPLDVVMLAYDLKSRQVFSTGMASTQCQVPGCEPGLPYKIRDNAIYFTTNEVDQGCTPPSPNCIPTSLSSSGGAQDLNGDRQLGVVLQIFGDADGDGVFDPYDNCRETPNTDQLDSDHDG